MKTLRKTILPLILIFILALCGCTLNSPELNRSLSASLSDIPQFDSKPYVAINGNEPEFAEEELTTESYEAYSELDALGRCGTAVANIGRDLMPSEKRESIGQVKPSGWQTVKYDFVDGKYLYNRCHLIGFQLTGENANERNLITGTRYMNVEGMLPFENMVADYVKETGNHVLYRVTPVFEGENLVASGVQIEAESVEDGGSGISFNVYIYNNQPGVEIDYRTGDSRIADSSSNGQNLSGGKQTYVLNVNSRKFHDPSCSGVKDIKAGNRQDYTGSRDDLIMQGFAPCGRCRP